ncbi:MAG: MFS transporter [Actinomycetes bacterium]|jgi:MFS family permease|nr:MFS transporter [Actinomycetes bacterium]
MSKVEKAQQRPFYGWVIVACAFLVIFLHMSIRGSFGVFLAPMGADMGWTTAQTSMGLSVFMVCYGIAAVFAGSNMDRFGPRPVFIMHGLLLGAGIFLSGYARQPWHFYLSYGVAGGTGAGALFAPPTAMVRKWFLRDLGRAMGIATAGTGLGFGLAPIVSMWLIRVLSWQDAMRILGAIVGVGVVIVALFTKRDPESIGQVPLGYEDAGGFDAAVADLAETVGDVPAAEDAVVAEMEDVDAADYSFSLAQALRTPAFWLCAGLWFCSNFAEFTVYSHSVNYATLDLGFDKTLATVLFSLIGFSFMVAGPIGGAFVDRLTARMAGDGFAARKRVLATFYGISMVTAIALQFIRTPVAYGIYCVCYGAAYGTYIPAVAGYVGTVFGRKFMGRIWGVVTLIGMAGGAGIAPVFAGWLRDLTGNYALAIWCSVLMYAITVVLVLAVRKPKAPAA